jgi:hypothetical protein
LRAVDWTGLLRIVVFVHLNGPAVWASSKWYVWVEPKPEPARAGLGRPGKPNEKKPYVIDLRLIGQMVSSLALFVRIIIWNQSKSQSCGSSLQ